MDNIYARGDARGRAIDIGRLRRHGGSCNAKLVGEGSRYNHSQAHASAVAALMQGAAGEEGPPRIPEDRADVPAFALCYQAYKGAKVGASYLSYEADVNIARACGAPIPRNRGSREIAKRFVQRRAKELRAEDVVLLRCATDIGMTMDRRVQNGVIRVRIVLGKGMPRNFVACNIGG